MHREKARTISFWNGEKNSDGSSGLSAVYNVDHLTEEIALALDDGDAPVDVEVAGEGEVAAYRAVQRLRAVEPVLRNIHGKCNVPLFVKDIQGCGSGAQENGEDKDSQSGDFGASHHSETGRQI